MFCVEDVSLRGLARARIQSCQRESDTPIAREGVELRMGELTPERRQVRD